MLYVLALVALPSKLRIGEDGRVPLFGCDNVCCLCLMAMSRLCTIVALSLFVHIRIAQSILPGMTSALYGDATGHSDFELNLRTPEESAQDVQQYLDSVVQLENAKRAAFLDELARDRQRALNIEKAAIHDMVAAAFKPLLSKLKAA